VPTSPDNATIADRLEELAALLDLAGASTYSVRAYRRAAELIRATPAPVAELVRRGEARRLQGVGESIEARLVELVETGRLAELDELERETAPQLVAIGRLAGIGPRRMAELGKDLGVATVEQLRAAAASGRLGEARGIGPKAEAQLRAALERPVEPVAARPLLLPRARELTLGIAEALGGEIAGDPRRWRDACERLAVVCPRRRPREVIERFAGLAQIVAVVERSERRALGVTVEGVPVELLVPPPESFGTELLLATGSAEYVAGLGALPEAASEQDAYRELGLEWLPPELRERPSREPAPAGLLEPGDIRGDLHCHTTWSDGRASVLEMGLAARELGYEYMAICDHTKAVRVVPGVDGDDLRRQAEEIAAANEELAPFRILRGVECDILPDGSLDLPDDVLAELEWVQVSLHAGQRAQRQELTRRVEEGMRHPAASCLSHPTGRLINHRPPNALDVERIVEVALETGVALEVNGLANRLDLKDEHVRLAVEAGAKIVCSTDTHSTRGLGGMQYSVATARRGAARAADVLNTRPLNALLARRTTLK
jgi:DNA polymerase (family X)